MDRFIDADIVYALARSLGMELEADEVQQAVGELSYLLAALRAQKVNRATEPATVFTPV